jgi:predicted MFS family arabinose efflux permease
VLIALVPVSRPHAFQVAAVVLVGTGQFLYGLAMGLEGPLEMGFRQSITPSHLQGRTNATMRSTNRAMLAIGAPLGGGIADLFGFHIAFWLAVAGMAIVAIWFRASPMYLAGTVEPTGMEAQI